MSSRCVVCLEPLPDERHDLGPRMVHSWASSNGCTCTSPVAHTNCFANYVLCTEIVFIHTGDRGLACPCCNAALGYHEHETRHRLWKVLNRSTNLVDFPRSVVANLESHRVLLPNSTQLRQMLNWIKLVSTCDSPDIAALDHLYAFRDCVCRIVSGFDPTQYIMSADMLLDIIDMKATAGRLLRRPRTRQLVEHVVTLIEDLYAWTRGIEAPP